MPVPEDEQTFASNLDVGDEQYELSWRLPPRVAGGYWRTPGVLQVAFWDGSRMTLTIKSPNGVELSAEITCLVLSADGLRVLTATATHPDMLVMFAGCE